MSSQSKRNKRRSVAKKSQNIPAHNKQNQSNPESVEHPIGVRREVTLSHQEVRIGPLPDPDTLRQYEEILPGIAERLVQRVERESEHRQSIERDVVDAQIKHQRLETTSSRLGQFFAFAIAVVGLVVSGIGVNNAPSPGHAWAAASIGGIGLASLVGAFIYGRKTRQSQDDDQAESSKN